MREESLISRLQNGDKSALEEIYRMHRASFVNWITYAHKCTAEQAIDIFQYAIISFYENVVEGSIEEMNEAGIKTYLFSIGKNKLMYDNRKLSKISFQDELEEPEAEDVEHQVEVSAERKELLQRILNDLGEPCKEILKLFYFNNLSADEIAEIMEYKNGNTVKNLKYKCLQRIKKTLNKD